MWALIDNQTVREVTDIDPSGRFHADFIWIECPADVLPDWLFDSGEFAAPVPYKPPAPMSCTPAQGLVALFALKRITEGNILAAIESIPDDVLRYTAKIGYQRATSWERNSPTMQTMAQLLQLSESDLDELFTHAASVNV